MKKTGIFYASTTGVTAEVAEKIAKALGVSEADIHNVAITEPSVVEPYDVLIFGASTWGDGDLQDDMADFLPAIEVMDLSGKEVAVFGCGDDTMSHTFCNAVGAIYDRLRHTGARIIGGFNTIGYRYDESGAVPADAAEAEGLLIDEVNHPDLTDARVDAWASQLKREEAA